MSAAQMGELKAVWKAAQWVDRWVFQRVVERADWMAEYSAAHWAEKTVDMRDVV